MEEAERLADRLALIDQGRLVALDTPQGLIDRAALEQRIRFTSTTPIDDEWLTRLPEVTGVSCSNGEVVVTGNDGLQFSVATMLSSRGIHPRRFQADQVTLDDAFVAITGRRIETESEVAV